MSPNTRMEEDKQDGPFAVWQMFNSPIMVLFNNLEHAEDGLDRLLTSILKLSGDSSEVIVPRAGFSNTLNSYYSAFNTWLIGRLFYICSVKKLSRLHETSIGAQLKILNILCINRAQFHEKLIFEYYSIINELIVYYLSYSDDMESKVELKYFTPDRVHIPQVQLNLEPIYVVIASNDVCTTLINLVLQLLSESIPPCLMYMHMFKSKTNDLLINVLNLMEKCSTNVKLVCLNFFEKLLKHISSVSIITFHKDYPTVQKKLFSNFEVFIQSLNILYEKCEVNDEYMSDANCIILKLLKILKYGDNYEQSIMVSVIYSVLNKSNEKIFSKDLKMYCLLLSKYVEIPKDIIQLQNKDASEIEMLIECYVNKIVKTVKNAEKLQEIWHYKEVIKCIESLNICENTAMDDFLVLHYFSRTLVALKILHYADIEISEDINGGYKLQFITKDCVISLLNTITRIVTTRKSMILMNENILKIILDVILYTLLLNEDLTNNEINNVLKIVCLETDHNFSESRILSHSETIKKYILRTLLTLKVIQSNKLNENSIKIILNLLNAFPNKPRHIDLIYMCPLLLASKTYSTSKLIGEILMPAFLSKDTELQNAITEVLPIITCMSLGAYSIVGSSNLSWPSVLPNENINIRVHCRQCHSIKNHKSSSKTNFTKKIIYSEANTVVTTNSSMTHCIKTLLGKFLNFSQYSELDEAEYWKLIDEAFDLCINILLKSTQKSLESNDYDYQSQTCDNIKEFGLFDNKKILLPVTKLLVYYIMQPQCSLSPKATVYLREVCERQGHTPNQAYHRYKKDYCKLFVICSLNNGKYFAIALLKVVRAFGFVGYRDFISKDVHHFLPYLMPYCVTVKEVTSMIQEIASLVQCSESDFLSERFPHIYVHVYLTEDKEVGKKCFDIIEKITKTSILSLIKKHFRVILTEFLLQYCCNPGKVLNACRYLACNDPDSSASVGSMSMGTSQIAEFLNPKFLGVLAYFDHKLVNAKVALSVKRKALQSFPDIMQLMGTKYLTPLRYKVLATLRSALPLAREFPKVVADAWAAFIHNIDTIALGPILSNLTVSLLQQISHAPHEINKIFNYLVIQNENLLSSFISDLFFMVNADVSEKIKKVIRRHVRRTQPEAFLDKIMWYLNHLKKEIPSIKVYVFTDLEKLLKCNRSEIHKAIFGGKNIDPVMVELIECLLTGCKDSNSEVSIASGGCLGQLGAIEAGYLPRQYVQPDRTPFAFSISDSCFAATALTELTRAFQYEKDTTIYDISPTGSKRELWDSFPENMHQIMNPLLSSRYTLAYPSQPKKIHPLFGTLHATTFLEWANNWAGQLIPLIESDTIRELLRTVHPSMRRDARTLFLFLPYVLLHAVTSKSNVHFIQEEMLAVINASVDHCENNIEMTERSKYKLLRHIRMTPSLNSVQAEEGNQSKCSKTVYCLLDFLNKWLLEWTHSKQRPLENDNYKAISSFLDTFDKLAIAKGNFACGELERALQYLEIYMDEDKDRIQGQLSSEPSLKELILAQVPPSRDNWGLLMGRILLAYRKQEHEVFQTSCSDAMSRLVVLMDGEGRGESALRSDYQSVLGLHIVSEAEHTEQVYWKLKDLNDGDRLAENIINQLLDEWRQRLSLVQSDELLEPTHPTTSAKLRACIGDLWLQSAKHARKAGIFQQSYMYILNAEEYRPEQLFIEKAKMYWARGQQEPAFTTLKRGLDEEYPEIKRLNEEQRKNCAKAKLLIAKYNDETTNVDVDVNIRYYEEAVDVFKQWEKSLVCLGAFYEKVSSSDVTSDSGAMWTRRIYALNSYGKALQYGHKYLYQSMPRMLSIWLDVEVSNSDTSIHSVLAQMTDIIKTYSDRLPIHLYLTAFSQIVSRICHPVKEVYQQLKAIIVKLILAYPQHTIWMMMCVIKSGYPQRIKRCADVFADPRLKEPRVHKMIGDFRLLAEKLIELCNKPIAGSGSIVLPSKAARQERIDFNIPTEPLVYIAGIEEQIQILPSLQKPRKVTLKGSDGKSYIIMLKPRDDLRKDFRLMEFNGVVNRFLQDAPETRRRRLYIRTYSVLPLNEENPNKQSRAQRDDVFQQRPGREETSDIRTTAAASTSAGLGDRHGENISFDSTNGDTVHVDFNCLFNKGEAFEWPERVKTKNKQLSVALSPEGQVEHLIVEATSVHNLCQIKIERIRLIYYFIKSNLHIADLLF
ncbi:unnamed protein product, partial [Leptidea sinapis]